MRIYRDHALKGGLNWQFVELEHKSKKAYGDNYNLSVQIMRDGDESTTYFICIDDLFLNYIEYWK